MIIKAKQLFIFIGDNDTGKTTIQKKLIEKLCAISYVKLPTNISLDIIHPEIKRKYKKVSFGNRSYQEKIKTYGTVDSYFENYFNDQEIAFISSHLNIVQIEEMIENGKSRFYNVNGIFFSNSIEDNSYLNSKISKLNWDEKFMINNPKVKKSEIDNQLERITSNIVQLLINRTNIT